MTTLDKIVEVLVIIGALNWGLVAINEGWNVVEFLSVDWLIRIVYALVGLSGLWLLIKLFKK
jgi:uncharacterized protein